MPIPESPPPQDTPEIDKMSEIDKAFVRMKAGAERQCLTKVKNMRCLPQSHPTDVIFMVYYAMLCPRSVGHVCLGILIYIYDLNDAVVKPSNGTSSI